MPPVKQLPTIPPFKQFEQHCAKWEKGCGSDLCEFASQVIFGRGTVPCDVAFIGEAPGDGEDVIGQPFVGKAGKVLDGHIERSLAGRASFACFNIVGCVPLRDEYGKIGKPSDKDISSCRPRLIEMVAISNPKLIVCLGEYASDALSARRTRTLDYLVKFHKPHRWIPPPDEWNLIPPAEKRGTIWVINIFHPGWIIRQNEVNASLQQRKCDVAVYDAVSQVLKAHGH